MDLHTNIHVVYRFLVLSVVFFSERNSFSWDRHLFSGSSTSTSNKMPEDLWSKTRHSEFKTNKIKTVSKTH